MPDKWDQYAEPASAAKDKWAQYAEPSTESPIKPPGVRDPRGDVKPSEVYLVGGEPQVPLGQRLKSETKEAAEGIASATTYMAAAAPTAIHRTAQKAGVAPPGDVVPGEHSTQQLLDEDYPNMVALVAGGQAEEGAGRPSSATPRGKTVPEVPKTAERLAPEQVAAVDKANRGYLDAKAQADRRVGIEQASKKFVQQAHDNIQQTYARGRGALDSRWGAFRQGMEGAELEPAETFNSIESAKAKYLKGSPASLQVFNNLAKEMGIQDFMEGDGGELKAIPGTGNLPFDTARVHYSAIMDKLAQGGLPGNVYQALKSTAEGLDKQLTKAAEGRGLGKDYTSLKADEHQFRSDWVDSESPLAKAHKALDANLAEPRLLGRGNEYLTKQLERYRQYGAQPELPAAARHYADQAKALPRKALPEVKGLPEPKSTAKGTGRFTRALRRGAMKIAGGHVAGFPGYVAGGEADTLLEESIRRRNARAATVPPPPE